MNTDQQVKGLQTTLTIDRETAARMGITPRMIDTTLNLAFGQAQVSAIYSTLNQYRVVMEVAPQYWQKPGSAERRLRAIADARPGAAARRSRRYGADEYVARGQSPGAVSAVDDFIQPAGRRLALGMPSRQSTRRWRRSACRRRCTAASRAPRARSRRRSTASRG